MRNIAVADEYEPGSVFKIVAVAGALNEGLVTTETEFDCTLEKIDYDGITRSLPREDASDHFDHPLTVARDHRAVVEQGGRAARDDARRPQVLRLRARVRVRPEDRVSRSAARSPGKLKPPEKWDSLTITRMPMGQSVTATALQMQQAMGVIASGGLLLKPQIISQIRDAQGELVYTFGRVEVRRVISEQTARTMARLLTAVRLAGGKRARGRDPRLRGRGEDGHGQQAHPLRARPQASRCCAIPTGTTSRPSSGSSRRPSAKGRPAGGDRGHHRRRRRALPGRDRVRGTRSRPPSSSAWAERLIPYLDIRPADRQRGAAGARDGRGPVIGYLVQDHALVRAFRNRPLRRRTSEYLEFNRAIQNGTHPLRLHQRRRDPRRQREAWTAPSRAW